jgi:hypothetical protein
MNIAKSLALVVLGFAAGVLPATAAEPVETEAVGLFAYGKVVSDDADAPGIEIGRPNDAYRRIEIASPFGSVRVLVTDGHLPYPYGRELTGYDVPDLDATMAKAKSAVALLVGPYRADGRRATMVGFPGGYIAEIHARAL